MNCSPLPPPTFRAPALFGVICAVTARATGTKLGLATERKWEEEEYGGGLTGKESGNSEANHFDGA